MTKAEFEHCRAVAVLGIVPRSKAGACRAMVRMGARLCLMFGFAICLIYSLFIARGMQDLSGLVRAWALITGISTVAAITALPSFIRVARANFPRVLAVTSETLVIEAGKCLANAPVTHLFWRRGHLTDDHEGALLPHEPTILLITDRRSYACGSNKAQMLRTEMILVSLGIPRVRWWGMRLLVFCEMLQAGVLTHTGQYFGHILGLWIDRQLNMNQWQRTLPTTLVFVMPLAGGVITLAVGRRGGSKMTRASALFDAAMLSGIFACFAYAAASGLSTGVAVVYAAIWAGLGLAVAVCFNEIRAPDGNSSASIRRTSRNRSVRPTS